jgi:hypothetical protein
MKDGALGAPGSGARLVLDDLEHELTTLAAHLNARNYRFLALFAEFDRRGGHVGWGIASGYFRNLGRFLAAESTRPPASPVNGSRAECPADSGPRTRSLSAPKI